MNKHFSRKILHGALVLLLAATSLVTATTANARSSGYTGANWPENGSNPTYMYGRPFNTFNRFTDNFTLCDRWGFFQNNKCTNDAYMDEREFITLRKVGRALENGTAVDMGNAKSQKFHNYTTGDLQEGDVVRAYMYVHNNASTIYNDSRYEAKDVRVAMSLSGNRITGTIKAKNAFEEDPSAADLALYNEGKLANREATFVDDATVQLPSGMTLEFFKRSSDVLNAGVDSCGNYVNNTCQGATTGETVNFRSDSRFSFVSNTLTYSHGSMVGSKRNDLYLIVDFKVVKSGSTTSSTGSSTVSSTGSSTSSSTTSSSTTSSSTGSTTGGGFDTDRFRTLQECVDGTTLVTLQWQDARVNDTLTLYKKVSGSSTEEMYTYTVTSTSGTVRSNNLRNSSGQALSLNAGDTIRWRVGSGDRFSGWINATVENCGNLNDNLRLDYARMAPCGRPNYNPYFLWNTPGATKRLEVSTSSNFSEYWYKDISNTTSSDGTGFVFMDQRNKSLTFTANVTYYWRIREGGKIYQGPSFTRPECPPVDCEALYGANSPACDDGKIVTPPGVNPDECKPGVCACVEIEVNPRSAGDFNQVTFTTKVSNQSKDTVSRRIEIHNLRPDGKKGYTLSAILPGNKYVEFDSTCTTGKTAQGLPCETKEQGDFEITGIRIREFPSTNRNQYAGASSNPIAYEQMNDFLRDRSKPILIKNLYPDDYVNIEVTGVVRTSKANKEFAQTTNSVDYNLYMKSQSNNGVRKLVITRPFLLTANDGDVLTSVVLNSVAQLDDLYKKTFGFSLNPVSGFSYNPNTNPSVQSQVNQQNLGFGNNLRGLTIIADQPKTPGVELSITSESDIANKLNIRPDQTRIFSTKNQRLTIGSTAGGKVELSNRSTIYVRDGDVTINSDIVYKTGQTTPPSFALVVENGKIFIDPRVTQLDGVYVVLGNSATSRIAGTPTWMNYYVTSKQQPKTLTVNGALYGNIDDLIPSRPNAALKPGASSFDSIKNSSGIAINFDGRIYSFPPPGLKEIIGGVYELLRNQR